MISPELLESIAFALDGRPLTESAVSELRSAYPGIHFTYCMDDDVGHQPPAFEHARFNLYLVDGREHCLCLTRSYEHASGIVVAEVIED